MSKDKKFYLYDAAEKVKNKMSVKKKLLITLLVIFIILAILAVTAFLIIHNYISKLNIVKDGSYKIIKDIGEDDDLTDEPDSSQEEIDKLNSDIQNNIDSQGIMSNKNVINILLIGTDSRADDTRGRSDSMILVSINKNTKKIIMTSFLRDMYVAIPGFDNTRLNHSYAYGGPPLLMQTLEQNFKVKIDKYVMVNFFSFVKVIDSIGGIDIDVTDEEVSYVNLYLELVNSLEGRPYGTGNLTTGGKTHMDGCQALAYSRIRYLGTDFGRSERQRKVLETVFEKAEGLSLSKLDDLLDVILPLTTTNIQESEIFNLLFHAPSYLKYERVQCRVPQDGTYNGLRVRRMAVLGVDFNANINYLRDNIYPEQ